jgi:hypothetical protein
MDSENTQTTKKTGADHVEAHPSQGADRTGRDISATTIGRMMGLATVQELALIESKIDLMVTKVGNLTIRMDKVISSLANAPTGADLERIDVHIGALRTLIKEALGGKADDADSAKAQPKSRPATKIISSSAATPTDGEATKDS